MRKERFIIVSLLICSLVSAPDAMAQGAWFYELGGAEPIARPAWTSYNAVPLVAAGDVSWNYSCGKFSMANSVDKLLRDVSAAGDEYLNAMVSNAQAAIASLPAIILQRANPTLYDIMQNGLLRAQAQANAARLDCKAMEETIIASGGGVGAVWDNFKQAAKLSDWSVQASFSRNDVVTAAKVVESNAGRNGISWIPNGVPGRAGGDNQPVIELTGDVMKAGYRLGVQSGSFTRGTGKDANASRAGLFTLFGWFSTADNAKDWIQRVTGEVYVTTNEAGQKATKPGYGMNEEVAKEADRIYPLLLAAVNRNLPITRAQRVEISPDEAQITDQLLKSIRDLPPAERELIIVRLANEFAMQNTIGRALMAIKILRLGMAQPAVMNLEVAATNSDRVLQLLREYIEDLMYESRIRKELVSETAMSIIDRANVVRTAPLPPTQQKDTVEPSLGTNPRQQ